MAHPFCIVEIGEDGLMVNTKPIEKVRKQLKAGKYEVTFKRLNKRSNPQNRYYWGICVVMVQEGIKHLGTDLTKEECHEFLKARFNSQELINEDTGEMI